MAYGLTNHAKAIAAAAILPSGTDVYVGLFTVLPTSDAGTGGTEATGSGYARKAFQDWFDNTTAPPTVQWSNNSAITFDALTGDLEGIVGFGIWDAATSGNLLVFGPLAGSPVDFVATDQPRFTSESLTVDFD